MCLQLVWRWCVCVCVCVCVRACARASSGPAHSPENSAIHTLNMHGVYMVEFARELDYILAVKSGCVLCVRARVFAGPAHSPENSTIHTLNKGP